MNEEKRFKVGDRVTVNATGTKREDWYAHKLVGTSGTLENDSYGLVVRWDDTGGWDEFHPYGLDLVSREEASTTNVPLSVIAGIHDFTADASGDVINAAVWIEKNVNLETAMRYLRDAAK